jgi:hypothetical protein
MEKLKTKKEISERRKKLFLEKKKRERVLGIVI